MLVPALIGLAVLDGASLAATLLFSVLIVMGQVVWLVSWNVRIEVDDEGISTFKRFRTAWQKFLRGGVLADRNGVTVNDGSATTHLAWKEVRIVERSSLEIIEGRPTRRVTLVTDTAAVVVDDDVNDFETFVELVYQCLPSTASVLL